MRSAITLTATAAMVLSGYDAAKLIGTVLCVIGIIYTVLGAQAELRNAARQADEQREQALLKPHAAWLTQHDVDREFNAMVAAEWTEPSR
jgi:hypothetical protein